MRDLSNYSFEKIQKHSYTFFSNEFAGSLVAKQGRFVSNFETIYEFILFTAWIGVVTLVSAIVILFLVSPLLGYMFLAWAVIFLGVVSLFLPKQRVRNLARAAANSKLTGYFADALGNILTIKSFASRESEVERFKEQSAFAFEKRLHAAYGQNRIGALQSVLSAGFQAVVILAAVILWSRGQITAGTIVLIQIYLVRAAETVWDIARSSIRFQSAVGDAHEMVTILDTPVDVADPLVPERSRIEHGGIRFTDVSFSYDGKRELFKGFDLLVVPGEKVGLVGHSGAGKTSITKLVLRYLDIQKGTITIDNQDIRSIAQEDLRRSIGYVPQEPLLFHRTLRDNIAYGKPGATQEEIEVAAKKARAHEFIVSLPMGYDTLVGERGVKLSGGERQRVAIARVMLKDAPILILDEATSALDSQSEMYIQEALDEAMKGRTTLVIAHRLSTIRKMDRILVFEEGKVIEEGSHEDLIAKGGVYSSLWNQQSGGFIADPEELTATT
jgi:ATP-binding cassette subfamily B protein